MSSSFLLFPVHLFRDVSRLKKFDQVYLIEDPVYFTQYKYHKLKLAYHRATMKYYEHFLHKKKIKVVYIDINKSSSFYKSIQKATCYEPYDFSLTRKLKKNISSIEFIDSPNFLVTVPFVNENKDVFFNGRKFNHVAFYKMQRQRFHLLMNPDGSPKGGKWSFDTENREKIPPSCPIPEILQLPSNSYVEEAKVYVLKHFPKNYGSLDNFIYPITHKETNQWLQYFIQKKMKYFGPYEDAETMRDPFLFHSVLTPMLNIGLITDQEVINKIRPFEHKIPIQSFEGFIRQIIGWRNYVLSIYILEGEKIRKMNYMNHTNKINHKIMWSGSIGVEPFDNIIEKINKVAYAHHIERLMYLGNFLFLLQIRPNDVFRAFMEWTVDAYDWVMVANVYCMSQYADGGTMMSKPYFSSANYILSMSEYKKGEWSTIWNNLYYHFINTHQKILKKSYSWARHVAFYNKKSNKEKKDIKDGALRYMKKIKVI